MTKGQLRACRALVAASLVMSACTSSACTPSSTSTTRTTSAGLAVRRATLVKVFHGDTRFDAQERSLVEVACAAWSDFTGGRALLEVVWDYGESNYLQLAAAAEPRIKRTPWWYASPNEGGIVNQIGGDEVRLVPQNCPVLHACAMHELGHILGLSHVADADAVMSATLRTRRARKFTAADRAECARVGLCD